MPRTVQAADTGIRTRPILAQPTADGMRVRMMYQMRWMGAAAAWPAPMAWPLCDASSSHPRAEQRESNLWVRCEVEVCAKALQQRTRLVSTA
jgi:hypothetical protein